MEIRPLAPDPEARCPVTRCLEVIGGKWKPVILFCIDNGIRRFGAMQRAVPGVTKQMLTQQLRELEADGIVTRTIFAEVPPRVEYALSEQGLSLLPVVEAMRAWGLSDMAREQSIGVDRGQ